VWYTISRGEVQVCAVAPRLAVGGQEFLVCIRCWKPNQERSEALGHL
jgi:hypothetical protein